ncbi:MAG: hypothetical protein AB7O97_09080 [Planctomycetota bacterium]
MNCLRRVPSPMLLAATLALAGALSTPAAAQGEGQDTEAQRLERLQRDQEEILRKAGRLRDLMDRLLQRYQRENKPEQVELLQKGLQHLERAGLLVDVAGIRDDLAANALSDAVRKQTDVVKDIESLLDILLQRRSIENLQEEIERIGELADRVRDLERRQNELRQDTQRAAEREPNAEEQALEQQLQQLAREQQEEARRNARAAGQRRPFLEDALRRVQDLLQRQDRLEQRAAAEQSGAADADRERMFDLGELTQQARALAEQLQQQERQQELGATAEQLEQAIENGDQGGMQQAKDRMEALLHRPPDPRPTEGRRQAGISMNEDLDALRKAVEDAPAGANPAERDQLQQLAAQARAVAATRDEHDRRDNRQSAEELGKAGAALQQRLEAADPRPAAERSPDDPTPAKAVQTATEQLQRAGDEARQGRTDRAQAAVQQALRDLEEARRRLREQNPDAQTVADQMAAAADATERDLRNAPQAEDAERQAADSLDRAEQALRQGAEQLGGQDRSRLPEPQMAESRQQLEQARETLQQALEQASSDRTADMAAAAERQAELRQRAAQAGQQLQQAQQRGGITEQQQQAAQEQMDQAAQQMQQAEQALQQGQQSTASQRQQQAAQSLQQAQQALQEHREPGPEQQQAMQQLAEQQQQLEEEILRLAQEARERNNPEARRALEEAADAARRAQQGMQRGDEPETDQQQQRAQERLDEAARQLEEERDRYLDQRQEELLFRMKEELMAFLEKQRPITEQTTELGKDAGDRLSRPARRKLNQFAEEEQELAARLQTLTGALQEEGNLVYRTVLLANHDDLIEVATRLSGRNPDPSSYTTMLQRDVERRTEDLLEALAREQKRREEERQQQQQQQQGENRFNPQRQKLVSLIAELEMLKQLEQDTRRATEDLQTLLELRSGDGVTGAEAALVERLLHRHAEVTKLFQQIKAGVEEALQAMQQDPENPDESGGEDGGRRGR